MGIIFPILMVLASASYIYVGIRAGDIKKEDYTLYSLLFIIIMMIGSVLARLSKMG